MFSGDCLINVMVFFFFNKEPSSVLLNEKHSSFYMIIKAYVIQLNGKFCCFFFPSHLLFVMATKNLTTFCIKRNNIAYSSPISERATTYNINFLQALKKTMNHLFNNYTKASCEISIATRFWEHFDGFFFAVASM